MVSWGCYYYCLSKLLLQVVVEVGYFLNLDFNGIVQEGFGFYQVIQRVG